MKTSGSIFLKKAVITRILRVSPFGWVEVSHQIGNDPPKTMILYKHDYISSDLIINLEGVNR